MSAPPLPRLDLLPAPRPLPEGRPAAVLVSLWPPARGQGDGGDWRLLFIERSPGATTHAGQLAFPGGAREGHDADLAACALREAQEEVGLDPGWLEVMGFLPPLAIPVSGFAVQPVVARVRPGADPALLRPQRGEVVRLFLSSLRQLREAAAWERRPPGSRRQGVWPVFPLPEGRLWGATAIMVKQLLRRWRDA
ncbi:MAG: CoA pyrophosphatase [Firmicutes bacterium]|nr:CoA pyrophosphatase [Bacillota bacterium]